MGSIGGQLQSYLFLEKLVFSLILEIKQLKPRSSCLSPQIDPPSNLLPHLHRPFPEKDLPSMEQPKEKLSRRNYLFPATIPTTNSASPLPILSSSALGNNVLASPPKIISSLVLQVLPFPPTIGTGSSDYFLIFSYLQLFPSTDSFSSAQKTMFKFSLLES